MPAANQTLYARWEIRDICGNVYHQVKIGNQVWIVENLRTDGTDILTWRDLIGDSLGKVYSSDTTFLRNIDLGCVTGFICKPASFVRLAGE